MTAATKEQIYDEQISPLMTKIMARVSSDRDSPLSPIGRYRRENPLSPA